MQTNYFGPNQDAEQRAQNQNALECLGTTLAECLEKRALLEALRDSPPSEEPSLRRDGRNVMDGLAGRSRQRELARELGRDE